MAISRPETIQAGEVLWEKRRVQMGNTTVRTDALYQVVVVENDVERRRCFVRWNGNPPGWWGYRHMAKLYRKKPKRRPNPFEAMRKWDDERAGHPSEGEEVGRG